MNKIVLKLTTAVSTAALLTGSVASVAFGTTSVTVTGNGASSDNTANVSVNTSKNVFQTNTANISNTVNVTANTGGNSANENTGGDASINTGDANVSSSVSNSANSNAASIACGSCAGNTVVKIADNGAHSDNDVNTQVNNTTRVTQANTADVTNNVNVTEKTGNNHANENTGGNVDITTGDATGVINVANNVNQNVAKIGGGTGAGSSALEVMITGNGAHSDNDVNVGSNNDVEVFQNNNADISNSVNVDASTGHNKANENTGGDTSISTGDANVTVGLNNRANFNGLDLSACDCEMGGTVKVAGNGAESDNTANVSLNSSVLATQDNNFDCGKGGLWSIWENNSNDCNQVNVQSKTGGNDSNENTQHSSDPMVETGNAGAHVTAGTSANQNVIGDMGNITIPGLSNVHDFNGLMMLMMSMFSSH